MHSNIADGKCSTVAVDKFTWMNNHYEAQLTSTLCILWLYSNIVDGKRIIKRGKSIPLLKAVRCHRLLTEISLSHIRFDLNWKVRV